MNIDYSKVSKEKNYKYDFCIIGAGIAGIITARELLEKYPNKSICIVESGDFTLLNEHNEKLRKLTYESLPIKKASREFCVGGATSTWGGLTSHFESFEIEKRDYLEIDSWPIEYKYLMEMYQKVSSKYNFINTIDIDNKSFNLFDGFEKRPFVAYIEAINYKTYLIDKIDLIYNAHVTTIISQSNNIECIKLKNIGTNVESNFFAKKFIISAGGLETIKLLLNSIEKKDLNIGVSEKNIGHYFMNHPKNEFGQLVLNDNISISDFVGTTNSNTLNYFGISLSSKIQKENKLMNNYMRFEPSMPWNKDKLVYSFIKFMKSSRNIFKFFLYLYKNKKVMMLDYSETGDEDYKDELEKHSIFTSIKNLILYIYFRVSNKMPKTNRYNIRNYIEMEPRFVNTVSLSNDIDELGQKKINVNYSISDREKKSTIYLHKIVNQYLKDNGIGYIESDFEVIENWPIYTDASHHCGGTVMGDNSSTSVVDKNLKVHGINNLYIVSSSVMPTSGSQNPTYTIAALACILVDNIEME